MKRRFFSTASAIVCALLIAVCAAIFLYTNSRMQRATNVKIYHQNVLLKTMPLSKNGVFEIKNIGMKIEVSEGKAFISQSRCRCKTCQDFGKLYRAGQSAICLPDQVRIEVEGDGDIDATL